MSFLNRLSLAGSLLLFATHATLAAGNPDSRYPESPQIHVDHSVTFRVIARNAEKVELKASFVNKEQATMKKGKNDTWEVTVGPLEGGIYDYYFSVDGTTVLDPHNRQFKKWRASRNMFEIPSDPPALWDLQRVPHGTVRHHEFYSDNLKTHRQVVVYTPAGYEDNGRKTYPVLFLLHGSGDDATAWTEGGKAHRIADNLIAANEMNPMIIVMPHGHAHQPGIRLRDLSSDDYSRENFDSVHSDFFRELIPFVQKNYRVAASRDEWSIAGLSMGGAQALRIGLNHPERFSTVGAFSSGVSGDLEVIQSRYARMKQINEADTQQIWIACGKDDRLLDRNQTFHKWLVTEGVDHTYKLTSGGHSWPVWRNYLGEFLVQHF